MLVPNHAGVIDLPFFLKIVLLPLASFAGPHLSFPAGSPEHLALTLAPHVNIVEMTAKRSGSIIGVWRVTSSNGTPYTGKLICTISSAGSYTCVRGGQVVEAAHWTQVDPSDIAITLKGSPQSLARSS